MIIDGNNLKAIWAIIGTTYIITIMTGIIIGYTISEIRNKKVKNRCINNERKRT